MACEKLRFQPAVEREAVMMDGDSGENENGEL